MESKELKGMELVEALLLGSAEIDRMRNEIDKLVGTIIGFLDGDCPTCASATICGDSYPWTSNDGRLGGSWSVHHNEGDHIVMLIHTNSIIYNSSKTGMGASRIPFQAVQIVRAELGIFADRVKDTFLSVSDRWQPLLDAAAAAK